MVNGLRLHIQHRLGACGRQASSLLYDIGHRIALVQEPELWEKDSQVDKLCKWPKILKRTPRA